MFIIGNQYILSAYLSWTSVLQSSCCYRMVNNIQLEMLAFVEQIILYLFFFNYLLDMFTVNNKLKYCVQSTLCSPFLDISFTQIVLLRLLNLLNIQMPAINN